MKLRSKFHLFLPILLLLLVAMAACSQDDNMSTPLALPAAAPTEAPRPLTSDERAAIGEFETQLQTINDEWERFYSDFDDWRAGLTACHPNAAQSALASGVETYGAAVESARGLPRTAATRALADLVITSAEAEETALRQLRDRWQAGNISLFEMVEQRRDESALAHNSVTDMSLELRVQLEDGPTFAEVAEMEAFSRTFDSIADDWDDFHDDYAAFAKRESKLEEEERAAGYQQLVDQLAAIMSAINERETSDVNEDLVDALQEAAEDEVAALQFLADFPPDLTSETTEENDPAEAPRKAAAGESAAPAAQPQAALPPQTPPASAAAPADVPAQEAPATPAQAAPGTPPAPSAQVAPGTPASESEKQPSSTSPIGELKAAIYETESLLESLEQSIDAIVNDKSAQSLEDLDEFDDQFNLFVEQWGQFYEDYSEWRATDGGCDRVEVGEVLSEYNQQAGELARMVDDLPQSGFLLPVYTLTVDAAERESGAIRTLANSWTPFAVDAFKAADDERVNSARLRRQASIALAELNSRP